MDVRTYLAYDRRDLKNILESSVTNQVRLTTAGSNAVRGAEGALVIRIILSTG